MRRLLALLASSVLVGVLAPVPASADPIGSCTSSTGTIIAVDFGHWGGPIVRGCGVNSSTGYTLLHAGGFTTAGTAHDGPAFICRIGNSAFRGASQYPTANDDACTNTPPASAYWSYWLAPKGQNSWSYSQLGAMSEKPKQGEVELWQFGGTNIAGTQGRPTISPDALRATNARATGGSGSARTSAAVGKSGHGSAPRAAATRSGAAGSTAVAATGAGARPAASAASSASAAASSSAARSRAAAASSASTGAVTSAASGASGSASGTPSIVNASAVAKSSSGSSSGSALPVILGVALVLLLGAGGGWGVLRRRRADAAEH